MKLAASCWFAVLLLGGTSYAQAGHEKAVRTALDQFSKAVVGRDQTTLNRLIAETVVYSHSNGNVDTKASFIDNVVNQKPTYEAFDFGTQAIRIFGKTALVRGKITVKDLQNGQRRTLELSVLQVWVHSPAGWQLVERQATRLNP